METYLDLNRIKKKMDSPVSSQKFNSFLDGAQCLDDDQIENIISLIENNTKDVVNYLISRKSKPE